VKVAARPENKNKLLVVILPDAGDRYHSSVLFESILLEVVNHGLFILRNRA
jgi:cysteine synthase A